MLTGECLTQERRTRRRRSVAQGTQETQDTQDSQATTSKAQVSTHSSLQSSSPICSVLSYVPFSFLPLSSLLYFIKCIIVITTQQQLSTMLHAFIHSSYMR